MKITITIDTDNAAWEDDPQQLRKVISQAENWLTDYQQHNGCLRKLVDINGNTTGRVTVYP